MIDSYGDGWNGNVLAFSQGSSTAGTFGAGFVTGSSYGPDTVYLCPNLPVQIVVHTLGSWTQEVGFTVNDPQGMAIFTHTPGNTFNANTVFNTFTPNCVPPACPNPTGLNAVPSTNSASLSWTEGSPGASMDRGLWSYGVCPRVRYPRHDHCHQLQSIQPDRLECGFWLCVLCS